MNSSKLVHYVFIALITMLVLAAIFKPNEITLWISASTICLSFLTPFLFDDTEIQMQFRRMYLMLAEKEQNEPDKMYIIRTMYSSIMIIYAFIPTIIVDYIFYSIHHISWMSILLFTFVVGLLIKILSWIYAKLDIHNCLKLPL